LKDETFIYVHVKRKLEYLSSFCQDRPSKLTVHWSVPCTDVGRVRILAGRCVAPMSAGKG
jgi:hypothetical protein